MVRCGRSRSLQAIELGTNRKAKGDFLLVFHCNSLLSFPRYDSLDLLVENLRFFAAFTHPRLVWSPRSECSPGN